MKTNNFFKTVVYALFALIMVGLVSCNNDDDMPVDPIKPSPEKGHDEWSKITFRFHMGHLHGSKFHASPYNEDVKYFKAMQEITYKYDDKGNLVLPEEPIRFIKDEYYALEIEYYDADGELINSEFATKENAPTHQHFFLTKDANVMDTDNPFTNAKNILDYTYRDTDPIDKMIDPEKGVILRPDNDPLGFKGYFKVNEAYTSFDLNVILVHIVNGNKLDSKGNAYPFDEPNKAFLGSQDTNLRIPVRVYTERPVNDTDQFFADMAKEFNITAEEAEEDWTKQVETPFESSNFWM
ncbi:MAG: hypothetical protein ACR2MS_07610 [Weeksellaceae bacterium]